MTLKNVEDTKGVSKSHRLKKDRQYNDQNKKDKRTNMIYKILRNSKN